MFGVDSSELLIVAVLALLFIGPKELPHLMLKIGRFVGKIRGYTRHFTAGIENAMREAELEEMEKKWREENQAATTDQPDLPLEAPAAPDADPVPPKDRELP
jgi:sec-independent protein translocase protein TatB